MRSRLPRFARSIEKMADRYGFDWRLVAAIVYQESHFDPDAESFTGVRGLMQVTTATAEEMGIEDREDPHQSISAGVGYLKKLYDRWEEIPDPDRLRFALASYNVGLGHVMDAQRIAQGMDLDPTRWSSIEKTLPLLRFRRFYAKSRYGYCRGMEPVEYVQNIMTYYDILRKYASAA
jgi:membrane-bound lytic murein transglycosylase F